MEVYHPVHSAIGPAILAWAAAHFDDSIEPAFVVDHDFRLCFMNKALEPLCHANRSELIGVSVEEALPLFQRAAWSALLERALNGEYFVSERCFVDPTASAEGVTVSYLPLFSEDGSVAGCAVVRKERGAHSASLDHMHEMENRFRTMANCSPVLLWMSERDSLCSFFNQTWLDFTGRTLEQEIGVKWAEGVHPEDFQDCMDTYMQAFSARLPFRMTYRLRRKDGEYRWILDTGVPRYSSHNEFLGYIGSCVDITERIQAEQALKEVVDNLNRSNTELERFAFVASHDLQEPLLKILSFCDLLQTESAGQLSVENRDYLQRIHSASQRMRLLINDLLEYSRLRNTDYAMRSVDLNTVMAETLSDLENRVRQAGAVIQVGPLPTVLGDPVQLGQLLQNLIGNALKYHRDGLPPEITIRSEPIPPRENLPRPNVVAIHVRDNGIGIEARYLDKIFEPFKRFHKQGFPEGTGIGLAICKRIVENHGGAIEARSEEGKGSEFTVLLPLASP